MGTKNCITFMCLKKKQKVCNVLCVLVIFGLGPLAELLTRRFFHFMDHTVLRRLALGPSIKYVSTFKGEGLKKREKVMTDGFKKSKVRTF